MNGGALLVIATPIGAADTTGDAVRTALSTVEVLLCEDTRHTRRLLAALDIRSPRLRSLRRENEESMVPGILAQLEDSVVMGLVSDTGLPAISDPGTRLVDAARRAGHPVVVVGGASAVSTALGATPWVRNRARVMGFLPRRGVARDRCLEEMATARAPTVVFESPRRVERSVAELLERCGADRRLLVANELDKTWERVEDSTLGQVHLTPRGEFTLVIDGLGPGGDPPPE